MVCEKRNCVAAIVQQSSIVQRNGVVVNYDFKVTVLKILKYCFAIASAIDINCKSFINDSTN